MRNGKAYRGSGSCQCDSYRGIAVHCVTVVDAIDNRDNDVAVDVVTEQQVGARGSMNAPTRITRSNQQRASLQAFPWNLAVRLRRRDISCQVLV